MGVIPAMAVARSLNQFTVAAKHVAKWLPPLSQSGERLPFTAAGMAESVLSETTVSRVSSVLNRDVKQFGKKFLFDRNEETCWNSDQGSAQWVLLEFPNSVKVTEVQLQFQGGFTGRMCKLEGSRSGADLMKIASFYPEDANCLQIFPISEKSIVDKLKIIFEESSDFFGRIILYHLDVLGEKLLEPTEPHLLPAEQVNGPERCLKCSSDTVSAS